MKIRPLRDKVVVKRLEEEEKKVGGIIIPDTAKEKPMQGKVMAVGPGAVDKSGQRTAPEVKKGDRVLFGKYAGTEVSIDGGDYLILDSSDIYAILTS
ncbi:MAG: co-chaperone GroES [bacterium]